MALKILPIAEALKKIYIKLGGDSAEVLDMSTTTELIQEIAELPLGGGGGGGLVVTITAEIVGDDPVLTGDKTYSEIMTALNNGTNPVGIFDLTSMNQGTHTGFFSYYLKEDGDLEIYFDVFKMEQQFTFSASPATYDTNISTQQLG